MTSQNHQLTNCKGDLTTVRTQGKGTITVKDTALNTRAYFMANEHTTLAIEGGSHTALNAYTGFRDTVIFTKARDWYTPPGDTTTQEEPTRVEISGNIHTYLVDIGMPGRSGHGDDVYDTSLVNLHLRGTWSMSNVSLWGNLGFDLETDKAEPVERLVQMPKVTIDQLKSGGVPDMIPQVIIRRGYANYNLWYLMNQFTPRERHYVFTQTLHIARQVLDSGCTIHQFCAFKDIHSRPNCRCALYYPLLFEGNHLALAYFLRAAEHTKGNVPVTLENVSKTQMEDILSQTVLAHRESSTGHEMLEGSDMVPSAFVRKFSKPRFMAFLKTMGITNASTLWRAP